MKKFSNNLEAITWLENQVRFNNKKDLNLLFQSYNKLNLNLSNTKKIHIGGTNGKGSTAAFISSALINNNLKVGLFTSPYLVKFNERIKINNIDINDSDILSLINYFYNFNEELFNELNYKLSFFEIITLMAFKHFSDNNCDVIIIEIGIGGRLDSTNIINYDATVITNIGFDHMKVLGDTLEAIALEKVGALKLNGHLITTANSQSDTFNNYASNVEATLNIIDKSLIKPVNTNLFYYKDNLFNINLMGDYQRENAVLAYETVKYLYNFSDDKIIDSLKDTYWPGRLEQIKPNVYIDGAHNKPAIEALFRNVNSIFKDKKVTVVFSALKDKDINEMLNIIKSYNFKIVLTSFPDFRFESLEQYTTNDIKYVEDSVTLLNDLSNVIKEDEVLIITGSLHFIGYIKNQFK